MWAWAVEWRVARIMGLGEGLYRVCVNRWLCEIGIRAVNEGLRGGFASFSRFSPWSRKGDLDRVTRKFEMGFLGFVSCLLTYAYLCLKCGVLEGFEGF